MQDPITIVLESGPTPWWEVALAVGSLLAAIGAAWAAVFAAGVAQLAATIASEARVDPMAVELYRAQADAARWQRFTSSMSR